MHWARCAIWCRPTFCTTSTSAKWRLSYFNRRAARAALSHILDWPIERVVIAHGDLPPDDGRAFVRQALGWLLGCEPVP